MQPGGKINPNEDAGFLPGPHDAFCESWGEFRKSLPCPLHIVAQFDEL